ncbi:MAG: dihydrodipicolinate synthase family protein [Chelatococcus sp.]|uniref:dihydrodipicolinate synthase family protein n=1 Tax=Chelatococcus sp. TaxID=1953771 RepID=UPI0025BFA2B2|nr:dihydrodipicolinate synthase family protein [Chelatococcus sp.]MBX3540670.1 dihydrodipicolinate synthase family protein [Chelatococcus sp.]
MGNANGSGSTLRTALAGISGVHATPYDRDGAVDRKVLGDIVERIVAGGIHNVVAAGNTGEFYALTPDEVRLVHDAVVETTAGGSRVTAAVGRSLKEAIALGRRAKEIGADAVMSHQPLDPFAAPQAQAAYFRAIAEEVDLPLVAYVRSDAMKPDDLLSIANHPNVAGVKFATTNLMLLAECVRASSDETAIWVCGLAEGWAAPFYALGARGFTSGFVNVDPKRSLAIHAALEAGDFAQARERVAEIARFETLRTKYGNGANVTVVKEALGLLGLPVGPVRLPGLPVLDPGDKEILKREMARWGLTG